MEERHFGPIWFIPGQNSGKYPYCNSIYIEGEGILIDPASDRDRLLQLKQDPGVTQVWLTHWHEDHFMHMDLFEDTPFFISREDAAPLADIKSLMDAYSTDEAFKKDWGPLFTDVFHFRPRIPSGFFEKEHSIHLDSGLTVDLIHTPGHTPGHFAFFFREPAILCLGDYDLTPFGPWYGDVHSSIDLTIASLHRLREIPAAKWLAAHETGIYEDAPAELWTRYLDVIDARDQKLMDFLDSPRTFSDIVNACLVYGRPREPRAFFEFGEKALMGKHLERLLQQKRIRSENHRYVRCE